MTCPTPTRVGLCCKNHMIYQKCSEFPKMLNIVYIQKLLERWLWRQAIILSRAAVTEHVTASKQHGRLGRRVRGISATVRLGSALLGTMLARFGHVSILHCIFHCCWSCRGHGGSVNAVFRNQRRFRQITCHIILDYYSYIDTPYTNKLKMTYKLTKLHNSKLKYL